MTRRINARIDAEMARKLSYLGKRTGKTTTEILRDSIESYFESVSRQPAPAALLADLVGCAEGPRDLAQDYKRYLAESLAKKVAG